MNATKTGMSSKSRQNVLSDRLPPEAQARVSRLSETDQAYLYFLSVVSTSTFDKVVRRLAGAEHS